MTTVVAMHVVRFAGLLSGLLALSGCASGESGMVLSRQTFTGKALVVDAYTLGLGASLHPASGGVTFGYRHTIYFYPREEGDAAPGVGRWTYFHTPLPDRPLLAIASSKAGVDLAANRADFGFSFGVESSFRLSLPASESALLRLHYRPHSPGETIVEIQQPKKS